MGLEGEASFCRHPFIFMTRFLNSFFHITLNTAIAFPKILNSFSFSSSFLNMIGLNLGLAGSRSALKVTFLRMDLFKVQLWSATRNFLRQLTEIRKVI